MCLRRINLKAPFRYMKRGKKNASLVSLKNNIMKHVYMPSLTFLNAGRSINLNGY